MRPKKMRIEPDACKPFRDKPRVLPRRQASSRAASADEQELAYFLAGGPNLVVDRLSGLLR